MPLANSGITATPENNVLQSFSDATAGRSQQLFWAMATTDSVGVDYILGRDSGISNPTSTDPMGDIDFDITINKPTIIAGIAAIDLKWLVTDTGGGGPATGTLAITLYHYDGSTETSIGTVSTRTIDVSATSPIEETTKLQFPITRKLFGIGDTLRLNIVGSSPYTDITLYHDPNTAGNELKIWLPIVNLE